MTKCCNFTRPRVQESFSHSRRREVVELYGKLSGPMRRGYFEGDKKR